ncbi:MAG: hypothetical protein GXP62_16155 [Oligoflexia bacterium]|nr:hypothetical protein [Oligoflexia bacterium]
MTLLLSLSLSLSLSACLSAATVVTADTATTSGAGDDTGSTAGGSDAGGTGSGTTGSQPVDADDDGWSVDDGDCNDADPNINPGVVDGCDGVDSDCDGETDEDAVNDDATEPNDPGAYTLGDLSTDPELQALASLHNDDDLDRFRFNLDDSGWSLFTLNVSVSNIPSTASYRVTLEHLDLGIVYMDDVGSGTLSTTVDDTAWQDDSGTWELTVSSEGGADCASDYLVTVALD